MAIAVATTRQLMANYYVTLGTWVGVCTGDPGTTNTPVNEATGGTPPYARLQTTFTSGTGGVSNGSACNVNLAAGTYNYILLASAVSGATMIDKAAVTPNTLSTQGVLVVTPVFTET
jgi:hypothetical protein